MVMFHSYVSLPEGKSEELFVVSLATEIVASHTLSAQRTTCITWRRKMGHSNTSPAVYSMGSFLFRQWDIHKTSRDNIYIYIYHMDFVLMIYE